MTASTLAALLAPAVVAWIVIRAAMATRFAERVADRPNERSLHASPRPRVGGIGIMIGALPVAAWLGADATTRIVLACAAALSLVSAADDARSLPVAVRLGAHFVAAALAVHFLAAGAAWGVWGAIAAVLAIAWMTNLYNFMDGSDGLAGGMAVIGFGTFAYAAFGASATGLALACAAIASASAGFLALNFPPARVFMGDAGSVPLGFLAGALGVQGALAGAWPFWFPILVFSPFIVDATVTLARRIVRREPFWRAHRSHYYQRLVLSGWSHRRVALGGYAVMCAGAATALAGADAGFLLQCGIIVVWAAAWLSLVVAVERHLRRAGNGVTGAPGRSTG